MAHFNPYNVIILLYTVFTALNLPTSPITPEEQEVTRKIETMLQEMHRNERYEMEEEESLDYLNDNDIPTAEQIELENDEKEGEEYDDYPKEVCTTDERISYEYKRNAIEYWKSGILKKRSRTLESVKQKFRKVYSLRQLRRWEI